MLPPQSCTVKERVRRCTHILVWCGLDHTTAIALCLPAQHIPSIQCLAGAHRATSASARHILGPEPPWTRNDGRHCVSTRTADCSLEGVGRCDGVAWLGSCWGRAFLLAHGTLAATCLWGATTLCLQAAAAGHTHGKAAAGARRAVEPALPAGHGASSCRHALRNQGKQISVLRCSLDPNGSLSS